MSDSSRPSMQSVQRSLLVGLLIGIIFGCVIGSSIGTYYAWQVDPVVYVGDAIPPELADGYQNHYLAMSVDSYIINQDAAVASQRLQGFDDGAKVRILAERSAAYAAAGRGVEAQLISNLALELKGIEGWSDDAIKAEVGQLSDEYAQDSARTQAVSAFSALLLDGQIPVPPEGVQPDQAVPPAAAPPPSATPVQSTGFSPLYYILCCLGLIILLLIVYIVGKRQFEARRMPTRQPIVWEGEGAPPLRLWKGTYELGQDNYDEFFTIETEDGDFLGESGMGIMDVVPGTTPKQVRSFDIGLFDKTDITTLSRVLMSEEAYNDEALRTKVEANPQAEAVLAEPGTTFIFETTALRVEAEIEEVEYGEGGQSYFARLKANLKVFLKEGADLKRGEMDVPDQFKSQS